MRTIAVLAICWAIGLAVFAARLPTRLPPAPGAEPVVVATGGAARVATGFDLLNGGARRLLITGVYAGTDLASMEAETGRRVDPCCVDLDREAADTVGNAKAAALWAAGRGYRRVRLVTSWYHMPRALLLFQRAMPAVEVVPHPVFPPALGGQDWRVEPEAWRLVLGEYHKFSWALLQGVLAR